MFRSLSRNYLVPIGSLVASGGISLGHYIFSRYIVEKKVKNIQLWSDLTDQPAFFKSVCKAFILLNMDQSMLLKLKLFYTSQDDPVHVYNISRRFPSALGLPPSFDYTSDSLQSLNSVTFDGKRLSLATAKGKLLFQHMCLTEDEKLFVLCRELCLMNSYSRLSEYIINSVCSTVAFTGYYFINYFILSQKQRQANSLSSQGSKIENMLAQGKQSNLRIIGRHALLSLVFFGVGYLASWQLRSAFNKAREVRVDSKVNDLLPGAGASYYGKLIRRNLLLRDMLGYSGEEMFTIQGNRVGNVVFSDFNIGIRQRYKRLLLEDDRQHFLFSKNMGVSYVVI